MYQTGTNQEGEREFSSVDPSSGDYVTQSGNFDRQQAFNLAKTDLNFLASLAMPTVFTVLFPAIHLALWSLMLEKVGINGFFRLLLGLPRGHAKTTLIKLFVLWLILFSDRNFILIICASAPKAQAFLDDVWGYLAEPNIINIFGDARITEETDNKSQKIFSFMGRTIVLAAVGQGSVRGLNVRNRRPDVIVFDDVQDKENAESETESNKLLNWVQSTAMKLRSPHRCFFIYIGNKYKVSAGCVCILERMQNNPLWISIVTGAILADGTPLWPELHSLESLMEEFQNDLNMGVPEVFLAEVMNDTESQFNTLIDVSKVPLNPYEGEDWLPLCQGKFLLIDVATNKIGADDTVIGLHGIYPFASNGSSDDAEEPIKIVCEGLLFGSMSPGETIENSLILCFKSGANVIGVESNAYQSSLLYWFDRICKERGIEGIEFVEILAKGKKNGRILNYLKQLLKGEVYLGNEVRPAVFKEALAFKSNKTNNRDNILDMGAHWQQMITKYRHLIKLPHSIENQEFGGAKVVENNSSF
jgi:hypothetical protein